MREPDCVGAFIHDDHHRIFVQRRSPHRRVLPGIWDVVGGHVEAGETPEQALARELNEETGWKLAHIEAMIADWEWEWDGVVRRELDYLVQVTGDLSAPRLEEGKHDEYAWVGPDNLDLMMVGRTDNDRRLRDIVGKAVRMRLTERLRLEPVGPGHTDDLVRLHDDANVAFWYAGRWSTDEARRCAVRMGEAWEADGVCKWMAYERSGRRTGAGELGGDGELVGRGGLSRMASEAEVTRRIETALGHRGRAWARQRLELGWAIRTSASGRGLATELGRAGLRYAFDTLGANEVVAFTERHNTRSRAVMGRLGMEYVGEFPGEGLVEGVEGVQEGAPFALHAIARS
ncbi:GNAT family N-acetyltransferase [Actinopolymorpha sp. B9G3]|uniref:GNAT family N-acetyltransferase n=1 Tax=Actinopolymorpha sp. B9G3 TaxID=3158970 RepID=UPI0032D8C3DE